jgi:hypothetical protein
MIELATLAAETDHRFAAGFYHSGADEQMLTAELGVSHALGISLKAVRLRADFFQDFGVGWFGGAQGENQLFDFGFIEQTLLLALIQAFWFAR